jgi:prefoldin subunit 5
MQKVTLTDLKARAYDLFAAIQNLQQELSKVNQEIQAFVQEENEKKKKDD